MAVNRWIGGDGAGATDPTVAANWSEAATPADGDEVIIPANAAYAIAGGDLTAAATKQFIGFTIEEGYTYQVGSLATYLQIDMKNGATYYDCRIAATTSPVYLDVDNWNHLIITRAVAATAGSYGVNLIGAHDADSTGDRGTIFLNSAYSTDSVGIGANAGEDMEVNKVIVTGGQATIGVNCTAYDDAAALPVELSGGTLTTRCPITTATINGGTYTHALDGAMTTLNAWAGQTYYNSDGTLTTANVGGQLLFTGDSRPVTVTTTNAYSGGRIDDTNQRVTYTNPIDLQGCRLADVTLNLGRHISVARGTI